MKLDWVLAVVIALTPVVHAAPLQESAADRAKRMAWFEDARFGLFIHWGVYSVPAGEWQGKTNYGEWFLEETQMPVSQYEQFAARFNPVKFDARQWVRLAKHAGMKYIVITSKHHDGFAMYRTRMTDWGIQSTPFPRDPLKELAAACKAEGIRFCFYHSIMDWHHPDWGTRRAWNDRAPSSAPNMDRYVAFMKGQLKELLTGYGPIGILWFDGEWESPWSHDRGVDLYQYVRALQPGIIINNRVGKGRAGMAGMDQGQGVGDYGTPEQEIPATGFGPGVTWESCMTMNNHWGYNRHDQNWKSTETLVRNLIDCASKGGNYLLNVGPTAEGLIPGASVERLSQIGAWMNVNRDAIYQTESSPFQRLPWGRCTRKSTARATTLYLHVFDWPKDGRLSVPGLKSAVRSATLLGKTGKLPVETGIDGVTVRVPPTAPDPISSTVVLRITGPLSVEQIGLQQSADGSISLPAADAVTHGNQLRYESGNNHDNLGFWTNPADWAEWTVKVTKPGRFRISAEIAALGPGRFTVAAGGNQVTGTAPDTGAYTTFRRVDLGTIEIPAAGSVTLQVRPVLDAWRPMNLRAILLAPI